MPFFCVRAVESVLPLPTHVWPPPNLVLVLAAREPGVRHSMVFSQDATDAAESALLAGAMAMSDGSLTAEQEEASTRAAKHLSLRRETVLQWLHQTAGAGGASLAAEVSKRGQSGFFPGSVEC